MKMSLICCVRLYSPPCSALWKPFVTSKKSFPPVITSQRVGVHHLGGFPAKMAREKTDLIQFRLADDCLIVFKPRRGRQWRLRCADAWMLAAFYKMSGQVRLPKTAFHSGWWRQRSGLRRILAGLFLRFVPGSFGLAAFIDQYCFPGENSIG